jgi:hypothetical protein
MLYDYSARAATLGVWKLDFLAQRRSAVGRNSIFTTKDTKITKKNRTICHIQYFVSFVLFVVKKFYQK